MEKAGKPSIPLTYWKGQVRPQGRIGKWFTKLPLWLIALLILLPFWICRCLNVDDDFGASSWLARHTLEFLLVLALFIPGALRRLNWRHLLFLLAIAGAWYGIDGIFSRWLDKLPFLYSILIYETIPVMLVGMAEWLLVCRQSRKSLIWIIILSVTVGCLVPLIERPLLYNGASFKIHIRHGYSILDLGSTIYWPLRVLLAWIAIPIALNLGRQANNKKRVAAAGLALVSVAAYVLFFNVIIYQIAHRSIFSGHPFNRSWSVSILDARGSQADLQAIWQLLERADWSKPQDDQFWDYRRNCIDVLAKQDRPATALRLSAMLREKPSEDLASETAAIFSQEHRYETAPILMRYALNRDSKCTDALAAMNVPDAALAIIYEISAYDRPIPYVKDFQIPSDERKRLAHLLGKDAGPNLSDWINYYASVEDELPTPLPNDVAAETKRVVNAMNSYLYTCGRLNKAQHQLYFRRLQENPNDIYVDQKVLNDMVVVSPDWNVPGTAALEQEVANHKIRVDAMIAKFAPTTNTTTNPSTSPSPSPAN